MHNQNKTGLSRRLLALAVALVMLLSMVSGAAFTAWAAAPYTVSVAKTGSGTVTLDGAEVSTLNVEEENKTVALAVTPAAGWKLTAVTVNGASRTVLETGYSESLTITADTAISVTFQEEGSTWTASVTKTGSGSVLLDGVETSAAVKNNGESLSIEAFPAAKHAITSVLYNGVAQTVSDATHFADSVTRDSDLAVSVVFTKTVPEYTLTVTKNGQGTVKLNGTAADSITVDGDEATVAIDVTPNTGWTIESVKLGGSSLTVTEGEKTHYVTSYTLTESTSLEVSFARIPFQVTVTPPDHGSITLHYNETNPVPPLTVFYGDTVSFTVTPESSYVIKEVRINTSSPEVCGATWVDNGSSVTFTVPSVMQDLNITAEFTQDSVSWDVIGFSSGYFTPYQTPEGAPISRLIYVYPKTFSSVNFYLNLTGTGLTQQKIFINGVENSILWASTVVTSMGYSYRRFGVLHSDLTIQMPADQVLFVLDNIGPEIGFDMDYDGTCFAADRQFTVNVLDPDWLTEEGQDQSAYDNHTYSGLAEVTCAVRASDTTDFSAASETTETILIGDAANAQKSGVGVLTLAAADYPNKYVQVTVKARDRAGNETTQTFVTGFSTETPEVASFDFSTAEPYVTSEGRAYFPQGRSATVVIRESELSFNPDGVTLVGTAADRAGNPVTDACAVSGWVTSLDGEGKTIHTGTAQLADANYELLYVNYVNKAGIAASRSLASYPQMDRSFTVDRLAPAGTVQVSELGVWDRLLNALTFGLWCQDPVTVTVTDLDATSPVRTEYFLSPATAPLTQADLEALSDTDWYSFIDSFSVYPNRQFVAYIRLTDYAGHTAYISTDGVIVDNDDPYVELTPAPGYESSGQRYGIADEVSVHAHIIDDATGSGLKSVRYYVERWDGPSYSVCTVTQEDTVFTFAPETPPQDGDLVRELSFDIPVDKSLNNSSHVWVYVEAEDNAGNSMIECVPLDIDNTAPTVSVTYERTQNEGSQTDCFTAVTAVVQVTEREEHANNTTEFLTSRTVNAVDAKGDPISLNYGEDWTLSDWECELGATHDQDRQTVRITFLREGNYSLELNYVDSNGNAALPFTDSFTLDATPPTGVVSVAGKGAWTGLKSYLTFGLWSKEALNITAAAEDGISDAVFADYYKTDAAEPLDAGALAALPASAWKSFDLSGALAVPANERLTVYLRLRDRAGNAAYLNTDGLVVDNTVPAVTLTPSAPNANGVYGVNSDVRVSIQAADSAPYSGIASVEYWVLRDGTETARQTLYAFEYTRDPGDDANGGRMEIYENGELVTSIKGVYPTLAQLRESWSGEIQVDKAVNNSCDVEVFVRVTDNAGNQSTASVKLDIDNTPPVIALSYDNNAPHKTVEDRGYYPAARTATIRITERNHHFDGTAAADGITITAKDAAGNVVLTDSQIRAMIGPWSYTAGATADEDVHTATIHYTADANYTFEIRYTDKAGNPGTVSTGASATPFAFTVDQTAPTGTLEAVGINVWSHLIDELTFGLFSMERVSFRGTWEDLTSPIESVSCYRTDSNKALTAAELNAVTDWRSFESLSIDPNARVTVYLRVVDYAGNVFYVSTDGIILDDQSPAVESVTPRVTVSPAQPVNGIYNTDVPIRVQVVDPVVNGSYAGLKEIRYEVKNMGTVTQSGTLFTYEGTAHAQTDLRQSWESDSAILVDRTRNNSNNVEILVYALDNAGNEGSGSAEIQIDITPPQISVSYDNNDGDAAFADETTGAYFNAPRTATLVVTERNFDPAAVRITLTGSEGVTPTLSAWRTEGGGGNGDGTRHIATLTYEADGDYTFDVACEDLAGNGNEAVAWNGLAPQRFTIDRTLPTIQVRYEPDGDREYFPEPRSATVVITERNFETSRIEITLTATDHGEALTPPAVVGWTSEGNVHTATISYTADARYSFDIAYRDKAGNPAQDYPADSFVVDQTAPKLEIQGVADRSANSGKEDIGLTLTGTDPNFDVFAPVITGVFYRDGQFVTETITDWEETEIPDGRRVTVKNLAEDGIYTVTCRLTDKAGNAFTQVTLYDQDGKPYEMARTEADTLLTFSVNRRGSAYSIDEATAQLVSDYYVQRVNRDVVIHETNTDPISAHTVTLNGKELAEGSDYRVEHTGGEGEWNFYTYTVRKELFEAEGAYSVVISSTDRAGNATFSDLKGVAVKFVVDRTAPVVAVSGMETDGRYQTELQTVTLVPTDDGGALRSLTVLLVDEEGGVLRELVKLEGDALEEALAAGDGKITFALEEGLYQNVRVVCDDWASYEGEENILYDETFEDVSVSNSAFMIFWANKPLRWGSIGGVSALGLAGIFLALSKKRKKKAAPVKVGK